MAEGKLWSILWLGARARAGGGGVSAIAGGNFNFFWNLGLFKVEVIAYLRIKLSHHRLKSHFELHSSQTTPATRLRRSRMHHQIISSPIPAR